jgi:hypothetical protein
LPLFLNNTTAYINSQQSFNTPLFSAEQRNIFVGGETIKTALNPLTNPDEDKKDKDKDKDKNKDGNIDNNQVRLEEIQNLNNNNNNNNDKLEASDVTEYKNKITEATKNINKALGTETLPSVIQDQITAINGHMTTDKIKLDGSITAINTAIKSISKSMHLADKDPESLMNQSEWLTGEKEEKKVNIKGLTKFLQTQLDTTTTTHPIPSISAMLLTHFPENTLTDPTRWEVFKDAVAIIHDVNASTPPSPLEPSWVTDVFDKEATTPNKIDSPDEINKLINHLSVINANDSQNTAEDTNEKVIEDALKEGDMKLTLAEGLFGKEALTKFLSQSVVGKLIAKFIFGLEFNSDVAKDLDARNNMFDALLNKPENKDLQERYYGKEGTPDTIGLFKLSHAAVAKKAQSFFTKPPQNSVDPSIVTEATKDKSSTAELFKDIWGRFQGEGTEHLTTGADAKAAENFIPLTEANGMGSITLNAKTPIHAAAMARFYGLPNNQSNSFDLKSVINLVKGVKKGKEDAQDKNKETTKEDKTKEATSKISSAMQSLKGTIPFVEQKTGLPKGLYANVKGTKVTLEWMEDSLYETAQKKIKEFTS